MPRLVPASAIVLAVVCVASSTRADGDRVVHAHPRGDAVITLDGRLDEAIWAAAPVARDFVERAPEPGAVPPTETNFRVLYDDDALWFGLWFELSPGETPRGDTLLRDVTRVWSDDSFTLKVDVRHDHRSTMAFAMNVAGTQLDAAILENGRVFRGEHDAVWEGATHVGDGYWSAEVRVPAAALGLPAADGPRVIGLNVTRVHNARDGDYDWSPMPAEQGPWAATHYGELHGVRGVSTGRPFTLLPYARLGLPHEPESDLVKLSKDAGLKAGGDVRLRLADDTWSELTILTDFAQVDVDDQVLVLDRFPVFFPERRPFFLSGLGVFEFGEPQEAQLLFTRRIGLDADRRPVPILGGLKAYGSAGPFDYGVLDVVTDDTLRVPADPSEPTTGSFGANWAVARLRANFDEPGHVGVLFATRDFIDLPLHDEALPVPSEPHISFGGDAMWRTADKRLELSAFGAYTRTRRDLTTTSTPPMPTSPTGTETSEGAAAQGRVRWIGEHLQPSVRVLRVSDAFDPALGFVRRTGAFDTLAELPLVARPTSAGFAHVILKGVARFVHDESLNELLTREAETSLELRTLGGSIAVANGEHKVDVVQRPFELFRDVEVRPDRYAGWIGGVTLDTPARVTPQAGVSYTGSAAFFGGVNHTFGLDGSYSPAPYLRLAAGGQLSLATLSGCVDTVDADGNAIVQCGNAAPPGTTSREIERETVVLNSSILVTPSTRVSGDCVFQINTQTEQAVALVRLRWRYLPGSDIFLVYQENISYGPRLALERSAIAKLTYRYDDVW